jgi:hypothetical protein
VAYTATSEQEGAIAMRSETDTASSPPAPPRDTPPAEWLNDMIDQLARKAFQNALDRRHATVPYRVVVESAHLVRTTSP